MGETTIAEQESGLESAAVPAIGRPVGRPLWLGFLDAIIFVVCALAVALALESVVDKSHVRLVFLAPVIAAAARDGWPAAAVAAGLSVLVIGRFVDEGPWLPPANLADAAPYAVFLAVAAFAAFIGNRARTRANTAAPAVAPPVAQATDDFRQAMLASLSHDFKAPLAAILGSISSLRHYGALYNEPTRDEMLANAQAEVERLNRYLGNLLEITRLDTGKLQWRLEHIDPVDVIGAALKRAEPVARNHRTVTNAPADLPMIPLDFMLAEQALYNLIENAATYAPAHTEILIRAEQSAGVVRIAVEDQGPGITLEFHERIFEPFYRIPQDPPGQGIGLGLPVARGLIEAMGGTLTASNRSEGGACFLIELPIQQSEKS